MRKFLNPPSLRRIRRAGAASLLAAGCVLTVAGPAAAAVTPAAASPAAVSPLTVQTATVPGTVAVSAAFRPAASAPGTVIVAAAPARKFANCTALNRVYPHGVGKSGAVDRVKGKTKRVTNFTRNNAVYAANTKSDRDKDGVACEKR